MHPVTQKDDEHFGRRIDPDRRAGETCVTKGPQREKIAAISRKAAVDIPT